MLGCDNAYLTGNLENDIPEHWWLSSVTHGLPMWG